MTRYSEYGWTSYSDHDIPAGMYDSDPPPAFACLEDRLAAARASAHNGSPMDFDIFDCSGGCGKQLAWYGTKARRPEQITCRTCTREQA